MRRIGDLTAFVAVARAGGLSRGAAKRRQRVQPERGGAPARGALGVRLLNRTTRSVRPPRPARACSSGSGPALGEVEAALDVVNGFRDRPAGTLRLNVPVSAARLVLPHIVPPFLAAYPDIRLEVIAEDSFVDVLAAGCDAGIRYDERLEQDMIAVPIGPRVQRFATAASPAYLDRAAGPSIRAICSPMPACAAGSPAARCMLGSSSATARSSRSSLPARWSFGSARLPILPSTPPSPAPGIIHLFEDWLRPHLESGALEPVLEPWWRSLLSGGRFSIIPAAAGGF
jgi:DNA-binding transcriptional LysR family regulator